MFTNATYFNYHITVVSISIDTDIGIDVIALWTEMLITTKRSHLFSNFQLLKKKKKET